MYLKINGVKDFLFEGKIMILVGLTDDENILKDERGELCAFKTGIYEGEKDTYNQSNRMVENSKLKVGKAYDFLFDISFFLGA